MLRFLDNIETYRQFIHKLRIQNVSHGVDGDRNYVVKLCFCITIEFFYEKKHLHTFIISKTNLISRLFHFLSFF